MSNASLYIDGRWARPESTDRITVRSAFTEAVIGSVPDASAVDVDAAVRAARAAFDDPAGWPNWTPSARAQVLRRFADALDRRADANAHQVTVQNGMPITLARTGDARRPGQLLHYYSQIAEHGQTERAQPSSTGGTTLVRSVPIGVVAAIVPWNFPNTMAALKYAPALAAGCTVVMKPAPETVLDAMLVAEAAIEAELPPGVLNIVTGGAAAGATLVEHPGIDEVSFTGSTATGRWIGEVSGRMLRPMTLELGGKSAAVMLDDIDLDAALGGGRLLPALFGNNGQTCFLTSRVLAPRSRYTEVVDAIADLTRSLRVGDPLDPATQIGPLVSPEQRFQVESLILSGIHDARLVVGGGPAASPTGWFVQPTVFADVDNRSRIAQEEIFGPVVTITPYDDDADAVRLANDSDYGLAGTIWSTDQNRAVEVARQIRTGSVGINGYTPDVFAPSTMIRASGVGLKFGPEAFASYQRFQAVYL